MFILGKLAKARREYTELCDVTRPLELRTIERAVLKNFDSICALLNKPELRANREPNLLTTLPRLSQLLRDIWFEAADSDDAAAADLSCLTYWRTALRTLAEQSSDLLCLLRDHPRDIDKGGTQAIQMYTQWSLSLYCILHELEAMFPSNRYAGHTVASSEAAAEWWQRNFGRSDSVTWHDFQFALSKRFSLKSRDEANELKHDVNVTFSDHVSSFEFDMFARLFAPWCDKTVDLWRTITKQHPAFVRIRFKEVKSLLKGQRPFSYLFRRSTNTLGVWSIGYMNETGGVTQILVKPGKTIVEALTECEERGLLLFPAGRDSCDAPSLQAFLPAASADAEAADTEAEAKAEDEAEAEDEAKAEAEDEAEAKAEAAPVPAAEAGGGQRRQSAPSEIYVVAPELECSLCAKRSDEVSAMEICQHILCDACFESHVQPRLYENWSFQAGRAAFRLFCPVCRAAEPVAVAAGGTEVNLISLEDDDVAAVGSGSRVPDSRSWQSHPLAVFDQAMAASAIAITVEPDPDQEYATVNKPVKRQNSGPPVLDHQQHHEHQRRQTNPFLSDFPTPSAAATPAAALSGGGGYLFYGSEEAVEQLLRLVPGLKCVPLPPPAELGLESPYGQIWDSKTG